jgi:hypothetical protein
MSGYTTVYLSIHLLKDILTFLGGWEPLGFELRASHLLGRQSYCSACPERHSWLLPSLDNYKQSCYKHLSAEF